MHVKQKISSVLKENYMPYAMSVIISRAIPEIDGFKPSHRKLLYTMFKMNLLKGNKTKCSNIVGQTMKLHPHGDSAIYETLVRLTSGNEALTYPLIDSKGNMGKHYSRDMAYAAHRYTEAKLAPICAEVFQDIDKDIVDFVDNFDGTTKEPVLLPTTFPSILVNSNQGIAVGMASNICPFNLEEVCDATIAYIKDPKVDIHKYIKAPDFPSGGTILYDEAEMREILDTGRGSFKIKSKFKIDEKKRRIEITEIPYTTTIEAIIDQIIENIKNGNIKEISDIRDETDLNGLKIAIDYKRNADIDLLIQKLLTTSKLIDTFSCNFNILINGEPKVLGIDEIIHEWIIFRRNSLIRSLNYTIKIKKEELHLLKGLSKILLDIDKAITIIRKTDKDKKVIPNLMEGFEIDKIQATFVSDIKLRNLNKEYILKKIKDIEKLEKELQNLNDTINSKVKLNNLIIKKLNEVKKSYGSDRKSEIKKAEKIESVINKEIIEEYNLKLFITKEHYIKKIPLTSLRAAGENKVKEGDKIIEELDLTNLGELLIFTDKFNVYKVRLCDIADKKASELGDYSPTLIKLEKNENIIFQYATENFEGHLLFIYENGKIAKVPIEAYKTKQNRKKLVNAYGKSSKLVKIIYVNDDKYLDIYTKDKRLICKVSQISEKKSKTSVGVQVIKCKDSKVINADLIKEFTEDDKTYIYANIPGVGRNFDGQLKF